MMTQKIFVLSELQNDQSTLIGICNIVIKFGTELMDANKNLLHSKLMKQAL
jgi:hypothetical protein